MRDLIEGLALIMILIVAYSSLVFLSLFAVLGCLFVQPWKVKQVVSHIYGDIIKTSSLIRI